MIRFQDFTIPAGQSRQFQNSYRYFKLLSLVGGASIIARTATGGGMVPCMPGQGFQLDAADEQGSIDILNPNTAAVTGVFIYGDAQFLDDRVTGDVTIIDAIDPATQSAFLSDLTIAFVAQAFVLPASNPRGLIVRSSMCNSNAGSGGTSQARLIASASAPVSSVPGANSIILNSCTSNGSAQNAFQAEFNQNRRIPPGWGLYCCTTGAVAAPAVNGVTVCYELK